MPRAFYVQNECQFSSFCLFNPTQICWVPPMSKVTNLIYKPGTRRGHLQKGYLGLFRKGENFPQESPMEKIRHVRNIQWLLAWPLCPSHSGCSQVPQLPSHLTWSSAIRALQPWLLQNWCQDCCMVLAHEHQGTVQLYPSLC